MSNVVGRAASRRASVDFPAAIFPQRRYKVATCAVCIETVYHALTLRRRKWVILRRNANGPGSPILEVDRCLLPIEKKAVLPARIINAKEIGREALSIGGNQKAADAGQLPAPHSREDDVVCVNAGIGESVKKG